jgi:hypothetical protein
VTNVLNDHFRIPAFGSLGAINFLPVTVIAQAGKLRGVITYFCPDLLRLDWIFLNQFSHLI